MTAVSPRASSPLAAPAALPAAQVMIATADACGRQLGDALARLRRLWNPWTCPAAELPLLAWAWSVDIWDDAWPEMTKRRVIAEAPAFHRLKGTVAGFRMALGYVGAELVRTHLPRDAFIVGRTRSAADDRAILELLPEIRLYDAVPRQRPGRPGFVAGRTILRAASDAVLLSRRAELRRDGAVIPLAIRGVALRPGGTLATEPERLAIPRPLRRAFGTGRPIAAVLRSSSEASDAIYSPLFRPIGAAGDQTPIVASTVPVATTPERVAAPQPADPGAFMTGRPINRLIRPNRSGERFYLSMRLIDGRTGPIIAGRAKNVIGRTRLRRNPFTIGLKVHLPLPGPAGFPIRGRVLRPGPAAAIARVHAAIAVTQAARDRLFVDFNTVRAVRFGDLARLPASATYGQTIFD